METMNIILFVFDTKENFEKSKKNLGSEGSSFKKIICVEDALEFEREFQLLQETELVFMVVHVFYTDKINGIKRFAASLIGKKYPNLGFMFISEGDSKEINKQMIDAEFDNKPVYKYHQVQSNLEEEKFKVYSKKEIIQLANGNSHSSIATSSDSNTANEQYPHCDYAIITALEEKEMEKVLPMLTKTGKVENKKHLIEFGHLKSNPKKTIVYASQLATGMIDAAVLTTEILVRFKPKFLIMAGVLGGKPNEVNIGDVVVATKVFTIDKGKITDYGFKPEIESANTDSSYITSFKREKEKIITYIKENDQTREDRIKVHFGSITCVRQVIDLEGFFEGNITPVDRKALALEMESYGVSRACEIVNDGNTVALIIKSAMDNTADKVDNAKSFAAWTSAMFVKYIFENDLI